MFIGYKLFSHGQPNIFNFPLKMFMQVQISVVKALRIFSLVFGVQHGPMPKLVLTWFCFS